MLQHLITQFMLYYLSSGHLWEVKNRRKCQTFSSESCCSRLQEVPNIVIWPGNFWCFGKLVIEERWSWLEIRLYVLYWKPYFLHLYITQQELTKLYLFAPLILNSPFFAGFQHSDVWGLFLFYCWFNILYKHHCHQLFTIQLTLRKYCLEHKSWQHTCIKQNWLEKSQNSNGVFFSQTPQVGVLYFWAGLFENQWTLTQD